MQACPIEYALHILNGKWKFQIIWALSQEDNIRYNDLKRKLDGISNIMLTQSLQDLHDQQIVNRMQYNEVPPRVEYSLTSLGRELLPALDGMCKWGEKVIKLNNITCPDIKK